MRRMLSITLVLLLSGLVTRAFATCEMQLFMDGSEKVVAKMPCNKKGLCVFKKLAPGKYHFVMVLDGKEYPSMKSPQVQSFEVTTAREAGTGMATGKRQHEPVIWKYNWGPNTPSVAVSVDGTTVTCDCSHL